MYNPRFEYILPNERKTGQVQKTTSAQEWKSGKSSNPKLRDSRTDYQPPNQHTKLKLGKALQLKYEPTGRVFKKLDGYTCDIGTSVRLSSSFLSL